MPRFLFSNSCLAPLVRKSVIKKISPVVICIVTYNSSSLPLPLQISAKMRDERRGGFPAFVRELCAGFVDGGEQAGMAGRRGHVVAARQFAHLAIRQQIHRYVTQNIQHRLLRHHSITTEKGWLRSKAFLLGNLMR